MDATIDSSRPARALLNDGARTALAGSVLPGNVSMANTAAVEGEGVAQNLDTIRTQEEKKALKMEAYLEAFYNDEITAGMLASNPALQLWVQQALQWENRLVTTMSNVLKQMHETRKAILNNIRA